VSLIKPPYKLLKHQKDTVKFLKKKGKLCILPTGTGKTLTSLYYFYSSEKYEKAIVVSENNLLDNVIEDNEKFFGFVDNVKVLKKATVANRKKVYSEFPDGGHDILVLNYHTLRNDIDLIERMLDKMSNTLIICDESENFREKTTEFYKALYGLSLMPNVDMIGLTASPVKKGLEEIFNILTVLEGKEPFSRKKFYRKFCDIEINKTVTVYRGKKIGYPITASSSSGDDSVKVYIPCSWVGGGSIIYPYGYETIGNRYLITIPNSFTGKIHFTNHTTFYISTREKVNGYKNIKDFRKKLSGKMYGVAKSVLKGIPSFIVRKKEIAVPKTSDEFKTLSKVYEEYDDVSYAVETISCLTPSVVNYEHYWSDTPKVKETLVLTHVLRRVKIIVKKRKEHVIIFTKYTTVADYVEALLSKKGYQDIYTVRGGISHNYLNSVKAAAKSDNPSIFILTEAGLRGLNLQTVGRIIVLDMPKSGGDLLQLAGRVSRLGSPFKKVYIYFYILKNTVLQDLYNLTMGQISMIKEFNPELVEKGLEDPEVRKVALDERDSAYIRKGLKNRRKVFDGSR